MTPRAFEAVDPVREPGGDISFSGEREGRTASGIREEVVKGEPGANRLRKRGRQKRKVVESERKLPVDHLLWILRTGPLREGREIGYERHRTRRRESVVHQVQVGRQRSAAGVAANAQPFRVYVLAGAQVVDGADSVPHAELRHVPAEEMRTKSRVSMSDHAVERTVHALPPLALIDGIAHERGKSAARGDNARAVVHGKELPLVRVSAGHQDRRMRSGELRGVRKEKMRSDVVVRTALENDLLDHVAVAFNHADGAGVERRSRRQVSNCLRHPRP